MKILTREDVDKLLGQDKVGRAISHSESLLLVKEVEERKSELGLKQNEKLSNFEFHKIIIKLKLEDVEFNI